MTLNEYQDLAVKTGDYPDMGGNLVYPALGLAGEAGEAVDKVKKLWRNKGKTKGDQLTPEERVELVKELGDCLWYVGALAWELKIDLNTVAECNIAKLTDRRHRGVIKSEGDNR